MPQNTVRFGAKCNAFRCKTQGKMVQNASSVLKNGQDQRRERLEIVAIYPLYSLYFR